MRAYAPIDCTFYDRLEAAAVRRRVVALVLEGQEGQPERVEARIDDLFSRDGAEYARLSDRPDPVRLDRIRSLDGVAPPGEVACGLPARASG